MIEGVKAIPLTKHVDDRGYLMEILRSDDPHFIRFGQVYITTCEPQPSGPTVKAWHKHERQTDHFCVIKGRVKVGLYDDREGSPTRGQTATFILGDDSSLLLQIPPGIWHGQMALGFETSYLLNIPTETYNRDEPDEQRAPWDAFPYQWHVQSR
jgi:dTDP-4-dehydrorhamnose 3,5-epimerase